MKKEVRVFLDADLRKQVTVAPSITFEGYVNP